MEAHTHDDHGHHEAHGEGCRASPDPHVWLSPKLVMVQAVTVYEALSRQDPEGEKQYRENLQELLRDLAGLHARIGLALRPVRGKTLLVFHPAWGYFADAYGLHQQAIEVAGKEPSARDLARVIDAARDGKAKVIFVQAQFSTKSAEVVARAVGAAVVSMDPLARDYLTNMERLARTVAEALGSPEGERSP
jgi:zinc transport system substrate-binding protein